MDEAVTLRSEPLWQKSRLLREQSRQVIADAKRAIAQSRERIERTERQYRALLGAATREGPEPRRTPGWC